MMRCTIAALLAGVSILAVFSSGCLDRKPAPVCPVPLEVVKNEKTTSEFDGVDLLVSIDNSNSMAEEQEILSTGFFTLINSLTRPLSPENDADWGYAAVENMRVAVVSSDMGLQWGEEFDDNGKKIGGNTGGNTTDVQKCDNNTGQNGEFLAPVFTTVNVASGQIKCEEEGGQCPEDFSCEDHRCEAPGGVGTVSCPSDMDPFAETTGIKANADLTTQVACMAQQGDQGCGMEQQLEAAMRGLEKHVSDNPTKSFLVDSHLLAVLVVSDEEDCSIRDKGLFSTAEWESGGGSTGLLNVACNYPDQNEAFLFPANREDADKIKESFDVEDRELKTYHQRFIDMKDGRAAAVIFAAIVGVPYMDGDETDNTCQGNGLELIERNCLGHKDMERHVGMQSSVINGELIEYQHFEPACVRTDSTGKEVTEARPGRRFVKVAEEFGGNGYVYSICNGDWSPAMRSIAEIIARQITPTCYDKQLEWELKPSEECPDCGEAKCDVVVAYHRAGEDMDDLSCPEAIYKGLDQAEADEYRRRRDVDDVKEDDGTITERIVYCPLPKIATPLDCGKAEAVVNQNEVGWYYCEKSGESFDDACRDGVDNDDDNGNGIFNDPDDLVDCKDPHCSDCPSCQGTGVDCETGCRFGVEITKAAKNASTGQSIQVLCLSRFHFEDTNCQEDTRQVCRNDRDDDGNGVMDCINTFDNPDEKTPHLPDPYCCPIEVDDEGRCSVPESVLDRIVNNCLTEEDIDEGAIRDERRFWDLIAVGSAEEAQSGSPYVKELDACRARISELGCITQ